VKVRRGCAVFGGTREVRFVNRPHERARAPWRLRELELAEICMEDWTVEANLDTRIAAAW
jgi:hypothetical protein